ncbi:MAG: hypothetical protein RLN75_07840 [Longimicrobiales bacterium]
MDRIPLLVVGHEPNWLAQQVADVFRSLPANVQYVLMDHCPERSPACFLAVDDLLWPDLPRTVHKLARRTRRVILLSWADPVDLQVVRGSPLHGVFTFPQEQERFRSFLSTMSSVPRLPDFEFRSDVPGIVVMAVRFLIRQAESPLDEPPPHSILSLAHRLGMDDGHLGRRARAAGLDLVRLCPVTTARWLRLYVEAFGQDDPRLPARLGYSSDRSVRRFVRTTLGMTMKQLQDTEVELFDLMISEKLGPVLEPTSPHRHRSGRG